MSLRTAEVTKTTLNGTMATFSALLSRLARVPGSPLAISLLISNTSKVNIAISTSDADVAAVTAVVVVVVIVVTMEVFFQDQVCQSHTPDPTVYSLPTDVSIG
jgi:hypothetical protein